MFDMTWLTDEEVKVRSRQSESVNKAVSSGFVQPASDEDLLSYESLEEMLSGQYYPGNYNPSIDQAICLIYHAAHDAIRWKELHERKG